ncbi:MAG: DUF4349 domain-containing protein [Acidimicrobiales bacterium]|jgi:polyhydroxyalkanoate synthesis regulator phasin|nr:DUF4349 domain-containing protein [Acidimicrobiales bacterium]
MQRVRWVLVSLLVGVVLLAGACAADDDDSTSSAPMAPEEELSGDASGGEVATGAQVPEGEPIDVERAVIYTADLTVRVDSVEGATEEATQLVSDAGGFLFAQSSDLEGDPESRLTFKVPPERFEELLDVLGALGEVTSREVAASDVTDEVVDLEGRLATARASAERLRALLAEATSTADIVAVESELAIRESEVESLEGQLRVLESQVDLATVRLVLTSRAEAEVSDDVPGVEEALEAGWVTLVNVALVVAAVAAFLVPFLPFVVLAWWGVRTVRRRRRRGRTGPPGGPPPPVAPAPAPVPSASPGLPPPPANRTAG